MEITVTVAGGANGEDLRGLRDWLIEGDVGLRGRVRLMASPPAPGTLGAVLDGLRIVLGPGSAATALVALTVSWLRHRTSDVDLVLTQSQHRSVKISVKRLRGLDARELVALAERYAAALEAPEEDDVPELPEGRVEGPAAEERTEEGTDEDESVSS